MATKKEVMNFDDIDVSALDDNQQAELENQLKKLTEKIEIDKKAKQEIAKKDVYDNLLNVAKILNGKEIIEFLLKSRKVEFKAVQEVKPIYLISTTVSKKKRKSIEMENTEFKFYEGKVILADTEQAKQVCSGGVDEFKKTFTPIGHEYFNNGATKSILVNFYNTYKPATATELKI